MPATKRMGAGGVQKLTQHDKRIEKLEARADAVDQDKGLSIGDSLRPQIDRHKTLVFKYKGVATREVVRDFDLTGIWTKPEGMRHNPSLHECNFWRWNMINECLKEVIPER